MKSRKKRLKAGRLSLGASVPAALVTLASGAVTLSSSSANAATLYFDNNGGNTGAVAAANLNTQQTWNTGSTNWNATADGTGTPAAWADGSDAVFAAGITGVSGNLATGTYNVSTAGCKTANSITVKDGTVTFLPSATPPTRSIGAGGLTLASTAAGNMTWSNANGNNTIFINASQPWTDNHATASIVVNCKMVGNATTGNTATVTMAANGAGDILINTAITDGTAGGNLGINVNSTATLSTTGSRLILTGANTYTAGTSVVNGELLLDKGGSLAHDNISIASGGELAGGVTTGNGTLNDNIANDAAELISIAGSGIIDLSNLNLNVNLTGTQTQTEYVIANAAVGSANVLGTQFLNATIPAGWTINYTGTALNPNAIVLVAGTPSPEPASLGVMGVGGMLLLRRRKR